DGIRDFHVTGVQTCALPISDLHFDAMHQRLLAVCEDHRHTETANNTEASTSLISISLAAKTLGTIHTLASGSDFYSNPRMSPNEIGRASRRDREEITVAAGR